MKGQELMDILTKRAYGHLTSIDQYEKERNDVDEFIDWAAEIDLPIFEEVSDELLTEFKLRFL